MFSIPFLSVAPNKTLEMHAGFQSVTDTSKRQTTASLQQFYNDDDDDNNNNNKWSKKFDKKPQSHVVLVLRTE